MARKYSFLNNNSWSFYSLKRLYVWVLLSSVIKSNVSEGPADRCPIMETHHKMFKREMVIGPNDLVKNLMPKGGKNLEYFVELELMLENIADNSSLYDAPVEERDEIIDKLREEPHVKKIIQECEELHLHPPCHASIYRTLDGTCNNLIHPMWGSTFSQQVRLLPPAYEGASGFRKSVSCKELPAPRTISLKMKSENHPSASVSALFTFFGQFVAHDMVMTPVFTRNNELYNCCDSAKRNDPRCAPIYYPDNDPFYSKLNVDCQNFVRALPFPHCSFDKRSPVAKVNSFLDMSTIYGNNEVDDEELRRYDNDGRMKTRFSSFGPILCENEIENEVFCPYNETAACFRSGDHRVNMHTTLTALHTIFVRLHNVIAESLRQINDHWNAEKTFQEVRRIVIAVMQRVTYGEYLPLLIGTDMMRKYELDLDFSEGSLYKEEVNPTLIVEFSGAAFRLHSMVPKNISSSYPEFKFADSFSNFKPLYQGQSDCLIVGSCELPSQKNDRHFIGDVSHDLFKVPGATYGMDQTSMNVQRGRDLGLQPYHQFLKHFSNAEINNFEDLTNTSQDIYFLEDIYDFPADIDAYVGIITENPIPGLDIGPTAAEIIAMQFHGTKSGDSFYFTHTNGRYPFTSDQIRSIEAFSLAQIICLTTNTVKVRQYPLQLPGATKNPLISCSSVPTMNMNPWREQQF
ncbi:salivary peroxidase/catechol oxidase isoform X1 [Parasteatoda tepidariorum]|uniref:salivary peroxidase/catechol oxidase isoform X1 n=1 Tax=Parasteatoda tepidariorum TaxID=114398 RepID=UPI001C71F601|nr:chorion peroxidase-like [Parasteatoda tepidariorum]